LRSLRTLAVGLRPGVLDELGLAPALVRLGDEARQRLVVMDVATLPAGLPLELQTSIYRVVKDAIALADARFAVRVRVHGNAYQIAIELSGVEARDREAQLWALEARVELLGGTLELESAICPTATTRPTWRLIARVPVSLEGLSAVPRAPARARGSSPRRPHS